MPLVLQLSPDSAQVVVCLTAAAMTDGLAPANVAPESISHLPNTAT